MPTFRYDYESGDGRRHSWWVTAATFDEAVETLRAQGLRIDPVDVVAEAVDGPGFSDAEIQSLLSDTVPLHSEPELSEEPPVEERPVAWESLTPAEEECLCREEGELPLVSETTEAAAPNFPPTVAAATPDETPRVEDASALLLATPMPWAVASPPTPPLDQRLESAEGTPKSVGATPTEQASQPSPTRARGLAGTQAAELGRWIAQAVDASLPLPLGLRALADAIGSRATARRLRAAAELVERGMALDEAVGVVGLPPHVQSMLTLGMRGGQLSKVMEQFCEIERQSADLLYRAWRSIAYPAFIGVVVLLLGVALFGWIVPQFESLYDDFDTELPILTRFIVKLSHLFRHPAFVISFFVVLPGGIILLIGPRPRWLKRALAWMPLLGRMLRYDELAQIARRLALLVDLRIPLPEALRMTAAGMPRRIYTESLKMIATELEAGVPLREAMQASPSLARSLRPFVLWGEASGALPDTLRGAAESLEDRARNAVLLWEVFVPQVMLFGTVALVGLLMVSLFMPLVKLMNCLCG